MIARLSIRPSFCVRSFLLSLVLWFRPVVSCAHSIVLCVCVCVRAASDANLSSITTNPPFVLVPPFDFTITTYTVAVNLSQQLTISANTSNRDATLFIDGARRGSGVPSGIYTMSSATAVQLLVVSQIGSSQIYTLNFVIIECKHCAFFAHLCDSISCS